MQVQETQTNKEILKNLERTGSHLEALVGPKLFLDNQTFNKVEDVYNWADKVEDVFKFNDYLSGKELSGFIEILKASARQTEYQYSKKLWGNLTYAQAMKEGMKESINLLLDNNARDIINKLC